MNSEELVSRLKSILVEYEIAYEQTDYPVLRIAPSDLLNICLMVKDDPELKMDCLHLLTAVDRDDRFEVVYHLYSYAHDHMFVIKTETNRKKPVVPSLFGVWKGSDYMERESYDLFGIRFDGHPNLKRLLLTDDWKDHPMRRDYKLEWPVKD